MLTGSGGITSVRGVGKLGPNRTCAEVKELLWAQWIGCFKNIQAIVLTVEVGVKRRMSPTFLMRNSG